MKAIFLLYLSFFSLTADSQEVKFVENEGLKIYYEVAGNGPALYILTGGPGAPPEQPSRQIIDSLKSSFTCILIHQRGSGLSRNIPVNRHTINIKSYTDDIEAIRKSRNDKNLTLIGISWGGLLAMNYAVNYASYTTNLVLIGSAPPSYKLWNVLSDNQHARRSQSELDSMNLLSRVFSSLSAAELDSLKRTAPEAKEVVAFKDFVAIHVRAMHYDRSTAQKGFDKLFHDFNFQPIPIIDEEVISTNWDITDELKRLSVPALIVYGRQDDQGESTFYLQKDCLKNSRMEVIEKCGHIMWLDQPAEFYRILTNYLLRSPAK